MSAQKGEGERELSSPAGISGAQLGQIFDELAATDPFREIEDPVAWQRTLREERPLPGREEE